MTNRRAITFRVNADQYGAIVKAMRAAKAFNVKNFCKYVVLRGVTAINDEYDKMKKEESDKKKEESNGEQVSIDTTGTTEEQQPQTTNSSTQEREKV